MRKIFEQRLAGLRRDVNRLWETALENASDRVSALSGEAEFRAGDIDCKKSDIRRLETKCEEERLKILLLERPVAGDLRRVSASLKLITDISRIGRQSRDICETVYENPDICRSSGTEDVLRLGREALNIARLAAVAFRDSDLRASEKVSVLEENADRTYSSARGKLLSLALAGELLPEVHAGLVSVAKYFEKIADHAENACEWVVFSVTGGGRGGGR